MRTQTIVPRSPSRSEEHTSELQSRGLISYAVFCLKKKNKIHLQNELYCRLLPPPILFGPARARGKKTMSHHHHFSQAAKSVVLSVVLFFFLMTRRPPRSPLFPSTPLFRSHLLDLLGEFGRRTVRGNRRALRGLGGPDRKSTRPNSSHVALSRMPSSASQ